ncbi:MAG: ATP-binding protein [Porphyromonadaceae bacterium]|nr:MAG: ATP-binding protein [Porphyromonadaceae bacterium]
MNKDGCLEVSKTFKNASTTSVKVAIKANHPTNPLCADLLLKKQATLSSLIENLGVKCEDKRKNACLRKAIWNNYSSSDELKLEDIEIDVNSKEGDIKAIWSKLQTYLPYYSLFQSDRKNSDGDNEIQDPLKEAVKQIVNDADLQEKLDYVATKVREKLQEVSNLTLEKIKEMNPEVANSLHPKVPSTQDLKWADVFKGLSITGDEDIPINKRGSGVKRLILLNFFRAEAERRQKEAKSQHIIYAIEEPETSQHKDHQRILVDALKALSENNGVQIIITTHSSDIVKQLDFKQLKVVCESNGIKSIKDVQKKSLPYPSLNEVNYLAFGDISEEYHNELYGFFTS